MEAWCNVAWCVIIFKPSKLVCIVKHQVQYRNDQLTASLCCTECELILSENRKWDHWKGKHSQKRSCAIWLEWCQISARKGQTMTLLQVHRNPLGWHDPLAFYALIRFIKMATLITALAIDFCSLASDIDKANRYISIKGCQLQVKMEIVYVHIMSVQFPDFIHWGGK